MNNESGSAPDNALLELAAMQTVAKALADFSPESASRVLRWAAEHFSAQPLPIATMSLPEATATTHAETNDDPRTMVERFRDAADLISHTGVTTGPDRALLAAYWVQTVEAKDGFDSYTINSMLKNMGYGLANVTTTLSSLMNQKPALVLQVKKSGQSKQARKVYRITREGENRAEHLIKHDEF